MWVSVGPHRYTGNLQQSTQVRGRESPRAATRAYQSLPELTLYQSHLPADNATEAGIKPVIAIIIITHTLNIVSITLGAMYITGQKKVEISLAYQRQIITFFIIEDKVM